VSSEVLSSLSKTADKHRSPLIVGVSGHRDPDPTCVDQIERGVAAFFDDLAALAPNTPIRLLVGLAAGADTLVANVALRRGIAVEAVLPMPLEHYAGDFSPPDLAQLHRLLAEPNVTHTVLEPPARLRDSPPAAAGPDRDALYVNLADTLARKSTLLIALWNGQLSGLAGGTADTVTKYLSAHSDAGATTAVAFVDDDGSDLWGGQFVYCLSVRRLTDGADLKLRPPCFLSGVGEGVLCRHSTMPEPLRRQLADLDRYNREFSALQAEPYAPPPDSLMRDMPGTVPQPERLQLRQIDVEYGKADALAIKCQFHSNRLFRWFSYMASVMGLLFLVYAKLMPSKVFLLGYLAMLVLGLVVFHAVKSRHWFSRHLAYRALAETMRTKFYLRLAAADHAVSAPELIKLAGIDQFSGFGWITNVLKNVEPTEQPTLEPQAEAANLDAVRKTWIESQLGYFKAKVGRLERTHKRLELLKTGLVYALAALTIVLVLFSHSLADFALDLGFTGKDLLLFVMGLLPVWLGIFELYQDKMATRELLWQYRNQLSHFSRAQIELAHAHNRQGRIAVLADLGRDSLMESYLWTIHRFHREHEPPAAG
jgi:hypothetical protein